jgi:hypothetical protein
VRLACEADTEGVPGLREGVATEDKSRGRR